MNGMPTSATTAGELPRPIVSAVPARPELGSRPWDPRLYQIGTLGLLLIYGVVWLDLEVRAGQAAAILATVLLTQYAAGSLTSPPGAWRFDPRSALISGLSLCLLLRTNALSLAVLTAVVAIASKFLIRWRGKHLFNPTNCALVFMMLATGAVWVSPGQWGSVAVFVFFMASLGGLVVNRAARSDVTLAFLVSYAAIVVGRSLWLGEPLAIPLHRLSNGALVLFSFFMISDPKTTPDSRAGRILFAVLVALGAGFVQFKLHRPNGLLWSLALVHLAVPLIDRLLPGRRYDWASRGRPPASEYGPNPMTLPLASRCSTPSGGFAAAIFPGGRPRRGSHRAKPVRSDGPALMS